VAVYIIPIITGLVFYGYTAIIGEEILIVDIIIFLAAVTIGQVTGYFIMTRPRFPRYFNIISPLLIVLLAAILITFTFSPPHLPVFLDSNTGTYGIP
jgi:hypothetical protein